MMEKKKHRYRTPSKAPTAVPFEVEKPMSSQIIKNAKEWAQLTPINTKRPATPRDISRTLFGADRRKPGSRPPSAVKVDYQNFDSSDPSSRPSSGAKLPPLNHKPVIPSNLEPTLNKAATSSTSKSNYNESAENFIIRRHSRSNVPRSPVRAIHPDQSSAIVVGGNVAGCYHPTPPPVRPSKKSSLVVGNNDEDVKSGRNQSGSSTSSSSSSCCSSGVPINSGGGIGSGERSRHEESAEEAFYWNQTILPSIEKLEDNQQNVAELCELCSQLHDDLANGSCFYRMSSRRRMSLLSILFRLLKVESPDVVLCCARIILKLKVHNKNFSSICKLIFRICREQQHDDLFRKNDVLDSMLAVMRTVEDPCSKYENYEAYLYLSGSVKFLSDNKSLSSKLYESNSISALLKFMDACNNVSKQRRKLEENKKIQKFACDLLVQVTTALRNIMDADKKVQQTLTGFSILLTSLQLFGSDEKIAWVLSRIFSKLTMYTSCIGHLNESPQWPYAFLSCLHTHRCNPDIVVRISFALGNIIARNDQLRELLFFYGAQTEHGQGLNCCDILNDLVELYNGPSEHQMNVKSANDAVAQKVEKSSDVLVKVVRVIANVSIGERVGPHVACNTHCVECLLNILETRDVADCEELIVNVLTTLNNLSYYDALIEEKYPHMDNAVTANRLRLVNLLSQLLMADKMTYIAELAQVFGNLTRHSDVRETVHQHKVDLMMVALLDSSHQQVVYNACGVLVNVSADPDKRAALLTERIISKLADVLRDLAPTHWRLGGVACQLLWNLCSTSQVVEQYEDELLPVIKVLQELLDQSAIEEITSANAKDAKARELLLSSWFEEFRPFARPLLTTLLDKSAILVPLDEATYDSRQSESDDT